MRYKLYDMLHLTAIGLTPGGSSTHLHTNNKQNNTKKQFIEQHIIDTKQYIEQHNSLIRKSADRAPSLRGIPWHLPYKWGKSTEKLSQGSRRMPVGTMKTERTEKSVYNNKNT
jgi:hypothetical protein